jgi:hypothetical protein
MFHFFYWVFLVIASSPRGDARNIGTKVVVHYAKDGNTTEFTTYTLRDRRRTESPNAVGLNYLPWLGIIMTASTDVSIQRCDLGQSIDLRTGAGEYTAAAYPSKWLAQGGTGNPALNEVNGDGTPTSTVTVEITTLDTGERMEILGRLARHVTITVKQIHDERWNGTIEESVTNGWYIDFGPEISCDPKLRGEFRLATGTFTVGGITLWPPTLEIVQIGARERGFPLKESRTATNNPLDGFPLKSWGSDYEFEVTQFVEAPLDPALFQVPAGFKHVERLSDRPIVEVP